MAPLGDSERQQLFTTALDAARATGDLLRSRFGTKKDITHKGRIDIVTDVDLASEEIIVSIIRDRHPGHDIVTEERHIEQSGSPFRWIVDPLDGTVNYAHDYPFFAVSIGCEVEGVMEVGAVYNPVMEEFFTAQRGKGAFMNGRPISVSSIDRLEDSLLSTGFPYDIVTNPLNNVAHFNHIIMRAQAVRRDGSAALNACYTAMGRFEGYWELSIMPWDIAAGMIIVTEAGGKVSRLDGSPLSPFDRQVIATNGLIHDVLVAEIGKVTRALGIERG